MEQNRFLSTQAASPKEKGYVTSSQLLIFAFATAFLSRLLDSAGAPSFINFAHFAAIPFAVWVTLTKTRVKDRNQIRICYTLLTGLGIMLCVETASAVLNHAGVINVILSFLLLTEPFILLLGITALTVTQKNLDFFKKWLFRFTYLHIGLALIQKVLIDVGVMSTTKMTVPEDNIQGVFYLSGGGHVVAASVSLSFGLYFLFNEKHRSFWMRVGIFLASFMQLLFADAKQVLLVCMISLVLLIVINLGEPKTALKYIFGAAISGLVFYWCLENIPLFRAFKTWIRPEIYGPEGEATLLKSATFRIVSRYTDSWFHPLLGLGPGHTVGRLGGWMLDKYWNLLGPLGATKHPVSQEAWDAVVESWIGSNSSMFSPLFGWAGIWGDLGWLGVAAYLYLWVLVWRSLCVDNTYSKFLVLNVCIHGLIFTQMEEPGYLLHLVILIAIPWHEKKLERQQAIASPFAP